jgi:hypothetical protein
MLKLRWEACCASCRCSLAAGTEAEWDRDTRAVTCVGCLARASEEVEAARAPPVPAPIDQGHAGASAEREYLRRKSNREARVRHRHPLIGGMLLTISGPPRHELAWRRGSLGEQRLARGLERRLADARVELLNDRRMPRGRGNIDHIAIAANGVFVIDAKAVRGKVRVVRPLLGKPRLLVAGRNRTNFADGLDRQVAAVRNALAEAGDRDVAVKGVLCFTRADLPLFGSSQIGAHRLHYERALARRLRRRGPLDSDEIERLAGILARAFPAA